MKKNQKKTVLCQICKQQKKRSETIPAGLIRASLLKTIQKVHPDWSSSGFICFTDLNHIRSEHVREILEVEKGEITDLEEQVIRSLKDEELLSEDVNKKFKKQLSFGERVSDRLAEIAGSWMFIISFFIALVVWIAINSILLIWRPFDPYPFILLNLVLSCLAAIQAPIILMSQNRQADKDRLQAEYDYKVNLKAELEIRNLHEKIDHLLVYQWQRLLEIQQIQIELMEELFDKTQ